MDSAPSKYPQSHLLRPEIAALCLALILSGLLFVLGSGAPLSVGDEIHHYRFAMNSFFSGGRAMYDAIYASPETPGFFYDTEALWPVLLSFFWRLTGGVAFPAAQLYQTFYFAALLLGTFRAGKNNYGFEAGILAMLLAASAPLFVSFGILFYLDMPAAAVSIWVFCLLQEKRYLTAGILIGAAYLLKKSTAFFLPVYFVLVLKDQWKQWPGLVLAGTKISIPAALLVFLDELWRRQHLLHQQVTASRSWLMDRLAYYQKFELKNLAAAWFAKGKSLLGGGPVPSEGAAPARKVFLTDYANSHILNLKDMTQYFGILVLAGILVYFLAKRGEKKDGILWGLVLWFVTCAVILRLYPDIRYLIPMVPFLCLLAAKGLLPLWKHWFPKTVIIGLCAAQFFAASFYTLQRRTLTPDTQEAFTFIRTQTPKDALFLYPETNILQYADRRMIWSRLNLMRLFWGPEGEKAEQILTVGLNYIVIKKPRVYDDHGKVAHVGGYPLSFVQTIETWPHARKVFDNPEIAVYEINLDHLMGQYFKK